ncbi:Retrovirus-related Pol polyprotein from transposon TNT 1-94, partial [Penicillium subrubescens]
MKQPTGHEYQSPDGVEYVALLQQALYGLRQAGHLWHNVFDEDLKDIGLTLLPTEPCIYTNYEKNTFVLIYVDDVLSTGLDSEIKRIRDAMALKRKLKILPFKRFLGCDIFHDQKKGIIFMNQQIYLSTLISDEGFANASPASIPMDPSWRTTDDDVVDNIDKLDYARKMGK